MNAIPPPLPPVPPTFIKFQYKALLWSTPPGTLKITHYNVSHNNGLCTSSQYRCVNGCLETISFRQALPTQCAWIPAQVNMTTYLNTATWGNHSGWMLSPASPCFASPLVLQVTKTGRGLEPDLLSPVNCPRSWQAIWVADKLPSLLKHLLVVYQSLKSSSYNVRFSTPHKLDANYLLANLSLGSQKLFFGDASLLNQAALFFMAGFHVIIRLQLLLQWTKYVRYLVYRPPLAWGEENS